MPLKTSVAL